MANTTDIFADDFNKKDELIDRLQEDTQVLESESITQALKQVDRKDFVKDDYRVEAYEDYPLPIGHDQTISQPTTVVFMLELLNVNEGNRVLDIGSGSGWTTALLAELVGEQGEVIGCEVIEELAGFGNENLNEYSFENAEIRLTEEGVPQMDEGPFDRILVSAAADEIPESLISQLTDGGIIVMPVKDSIIKAVKIPQGDGYRLKKERHQGFTFVDFQK